MSLTLHSGGWLFYAAAAVAYLAYLATPRPWLGKVATAILAFGFAGHSVCFVIQGFGEGIPFESRALVMSVFAWGIVGAYLLAQLLQRMTVLGAFVAPVATVFALLAEAIPGGPGGEAHSLSGWWLGAHIITVSLGYAAFAVSFCVAVVYLIQERFLKARHLGALFRRLPPLDSLDRLNQVAILAGFVLLSIGLFLGASWVTVYPKPGYRIWADPLVLFTSSLWVWYAFAVQSRLFAGWRGRKSAYFAIVGFAAMLISIVGIGLTTSFHFFKAG